MVDGGEVAMWDTGLYIEGLFRVALVTDFDTPAVVLKWPSSTLGRLLQFF